MKTKSCTINKSFKLTYTHLIKELLLNLFFYFNLMQCSQLLRFKYRPIYSVGVSQK